MGSKINCSAESEVKRYHLGAARARRERGAKGTYLINEDIHHITILGALF